MYCNIVLAVVLISQTQSTAQAAHSSTRPQLYKHECSRSLKRIVTNLSMCCPCDAVSWLYNIPTNRNGKLIRCAVSAMLAY